MRATERRRRGRAALGALALLLPVVLAACTAPTVPPLAQFTVDVLPSDLSNHVWHDTYRYDSIGCGGFTGDVPPLRPPAGRLLVGANNSFDPGSGPFPCIGKDDFAYRGGVRFELSQFQRLKRKLVVKAVLSWTIESAVVRDGNGNRHGVASGRDATNCVGGVLESTESIWTEGDFLPGIPYRTGRGDVTSLVSSWIMAGDPNYGFVLKGLDESYSRNNAACLNTIGSLRLTLTYLAPPS